MYILIRLGHINEINENQSIELPWMPICLLLTVISFIMQYDCMVMDGWWLWTIPLNQLWLAVLWMGCINFSRVVNFWWCIIYLGLACHLLLSLYHSLMYPTFPFCILFFILCKCYIIESALRSMVDPKEHDRAQQANGGDH